MLTGMFSQKIPSQLFKGLPFLSQETGGFSQPVEDAGIVLLRQKGEQMMTYPVSEVPL
jgi:hypothetical protein